MSHPEVTSTGLDEGQRKVLANRIREIAPVLEQDGRFTIRDIDGADDPRTVMLILKRNGAIKCHGKTKVRRAYESRNTEKVDFINEWEWVDDAKEWLQTYLSEMDTLPCDHRAHICNRPEVDGFSCQYCIDEGEYPEYSRELVAELVGV